jgi:hypothetical protein
MTTTDPSGASLINLTIQKKLKNTKEQKQVVGPLVERLCSIGWQLDQIIFGKKEWYVPKTVVLQKNSVYTRYWGSSTLCSTTNCSHNIFCKTTAKSTK